MLDSNKTKADLQLVTLTFPNGENLGIEFNGPVFFESIEPVIEEPRTYQDMYIRAPMSTTSRISFLIERNEDTGVAYTLFSFGEANE